MAENMMVDAQRTLDDPSKCCVDACKADNRDDRGGEMVRCCLCQIWFHASCLKLGKEEQIGVWCCFDCRHLTKTVTSTMQNVYRLVDLVEKMQKSIDLLTRKQTEMQTSISDKDKECTSLRQENGRLLTKIGEMQRQLDKQAWDKNRDVAAPKTLVLGSSLVKHMDENKMVKTTVISRSGGSLDDMTKSLESIPVGSAHEHVILLAGGNDLRDSEPGEVIEKYKKTLKAAKEISENVTVSGIPPRLDPDDFQEKVTTLNAGLQVLAAEENCKFVDHQQTFFLMSGEVNVGFLENDKVHPNMIGTNHIAKALGIVCKNRQRYDVATRKPKRHQRHNQKPRPDITDPEEDGEFDGYDYSFWRRAREK